MLKKRLGVIGLGQRSVAMLKLLADVADFEIFAVCDVFADRVESAQRLVLEKTGHTPLGFLSADELIAREDIDVVFIFAAWEAHIPLVIKCMQAGKITAVEVGGAYSADECRRLVRTYEQTGSPVMMLENCCYGRREMMIYNMAKAGLFGSIVHCDGGYCHDLRDEIASGEKIRHYRLRNYAARCCDNYPTHELGPIAKLLDINRGNRFLTLSSFASGAHGMREYALSRGEGRTEYMQGDIITTVITCARGQTIKLTLDTTLPRSSTRMYAVHGTRGVYEEQTDSFYFENNPEHTKMCRENDWRAQWGNARDYEAEYDHPMWKEFIKAKGGARGSHGGMDRLMIDDFARCVRENRPFPIDVYDMASWMCVSALSEQSIAAGGAPVPFPDFTDGKWILPR